MKKTTATDKAGQEISVGSLIIYGHALGRCAGLRYGKVLKITWKTETQYDHKAKEHKEVQVPHFQVQGVDDDWDFQAPELNKRKGTLQFGTRILVVSRGQVPEPVLKLLDLVEVEKPVLTCQDCGTTEGVTETTCPYASDVDNEIEKIVACEACVDERARDI